MFRTLIHPPVHSTRLRIESDIKCHTEQLKYLQKKADQRENKLSLCQQKRSHTTPWTYEIIITTLDAGISITLSTATVIATAALLLVLLTSFILTNILCPNEMSRMLQMLFSKRGI